MTTATPEGSTHPSPAEVMARFGREVLNGKDASVIDELAAEDFVELDPLPGQGSDRAGLKAFFTDVFFPAFPDAEWVTNEQILEGEKVVSRFVWSGTHQGPFMGMPPTGRRVSVRGVVIDRVVDGRWKDSRILMDALSMLQQLGAVPGPPGPPA